MQLHSAPFFDVATAYSAGLYHSMLKHACIFLLIQPDFFTGSTLLIYTQYFWVFICKLQITNFKLRKLQQTVNSNPPKKY